jgi:DNA-binding LytR/AlgR family response regulator
MADQDNIKLTKPMTVDEAAKRVRRTVIEMVDGKDEAGKPVKVPRAKDVAVQAAEVLSFKDYGSYVVVVTKDGKKLTSASAGE